MIQGYHGKHRILKVQHMRTSLVTIHAGLCKAALFEHGHDNCEVCPIDPRGCQKVKDDIQGLLDRGELVVE